MTRTYVVCNSCGETFHEKLKPTVRTGCPVCQEANYETKDIPVDFKSAKMLEDFLATKPMLWIVDTINDNYTHKFNAKCNYVKSSPDIFFMALEIEGNSVITPLEGEHVTTNYGVGYFVRHYIKNNQKYAHFYYISESMIKVNHPDLDI